MRRCRAEVLFSPSDGGAYGFCRVSLAVHRWHQYPPNLWCRLNRRLEIALIVQESNFADESARLLLFPHPGSVAEKRPKPRVAQQPGPHFFARERFRISTAKVMEPMFCLLAAMVLGAVAEACQAPVLYPLVVWIGLGTVSLTVDYAVYRGLMERRARAMQRAAELTSSTRPIFPLGRKSN